MRVIASKSNPALRMRALRMRALRMCAFRMRLLSHPLCASRLQVDEVDGLEGKLVRETASDWLDKAKERLALQQAVQVVRAHVTTLATSLE